MARRSEEQQTTHDKGVLAEAKELERDGWNVRADVTGEDFEQPPEVSGTDLTYLQRSMAEPG